MSSYTQGASLAYEQGKDKLKDKLSKSYWHVSFDEKEALWRDEDGYLVPLMGARPDGHSWFNLGLFDRDWHAGGRLLCFRESLHVSTTRNA